MYRGNAKRKIRISEDGPLLTMAAIINIESKRANRISSAYPIIIPIGP